MKVIKIHEFEKDKAWESIQISEMNGVTLKLHWTDHPYIWHKNDGNKVFAVMEGSVRMWYKIKGDEDIVILETGDVFYADAGDEHKAEPIGVAKVLEIEKSGSI